MTVENDENFLTNTPRISEITERLFSNIRASDKNFNANTLPKKRNLIKSLPVMDKNRYSPINNTRINQSQNGSVETIDNCPSKMKENEQTKDNKDNHKAKSNNQSCITVNMDLSEEVTTLLDDDENEDSECTSDTSDDLHKVIGHFTLIITIQFLTLNKLQV